MQPWHGQRLMSCRSYIARECFREPTHIADKRESLNSPLFKWKPWFERGSTHVLIASKRFHVPWQGQHIAFAMVRAGRRWHLLAPCCIGGLMF